MTIALCFSGQPRAFRQGYEYYARNLFDGNDVDVFIHTWECEDAEDLIKWYKPKAFRIDPPLQGNFDEKYTNSAPDRKKWPPRNVVSSYYSIFQSCLMKIDEEVRNKRYEWVIKSRTDFALNGKIPYRDLDPTKLYIPGCRRVPTRDFGNDQFAVGTSMVMNKYMSTYLNLDTYYYAGHAMIGEDMMRANLHEHGLVGDRLVYMDMNHPFPPGPHNGTPHSLIRDDYDQWAKSSKN